MRLPTALSAFALCAAAAVAQATVVVRASVEDLTDRCRCAVVGRVLDRTVEVEPDTGWVWTRHRVALETTWVGSEQDEVVVSVPGGTVGDVTQEFHGGARLAPGARVVVFAWKDDAGRLQVLGEAQGAFVVTRDATTGDDVCENSIEGLAFVDPTGDPVKAERTRLRFDELRSRVLGARAAREARARAAQERRDRRIAARRTRAERLAPHLRGRPGAPGS